MKFLIACALIVLSACNTLENTNPQNVGATNSSGIEGTVMIGPSCPVQRLNDPNCNDRPYQGVIHVTGGDKTQVAQFQADANGKFKLELEPGNYTLKPQTMNLIARASDQDVTVAAGTFATVSIRYDSGLR
jgi:hypothetical protein